MNKLPKTVTKKNKKSNYYKKKNANVKNLQHKINLIIFYYLKLNLVKNLKFFKLITSKMKLQKKEKFH
jgi:hypothetical protein